jgi:two-component system sensor histidine kinase HydH
MANEHKNHLWLSLTPWAILGSLAVLAPIVFFLASSSIREDKANMTRLLMEKGAALIRSFEAGARTGMMGMGWGGMQLQRLLEETAKQPDILYLVVTDESGSAIAHSNPDRIGLKHLSKVELSPSEELERVRSHQVRMENGSSAFEVYKRFKPLRAPPGRGSGHHRGMMMGRFGSGRDWNPGYAERDPAGPTVMPIYIFVGLDTSAMESARVDARRHTLAMSAIVLLVGLAGLVSLFLAQGYKLAKRSLAKVQAYSDQVVENLPIGLVASDENGRVAAFNETAVAILGSSSKNVLGKAAAEALPSELWKLTALLEQTSAVVEQELECATSRGTHLPLRVSTASLRDEEGTFLGYVFLLRDLTEVRRLQLEVERSKRMASLGSLAAGVAHEIRNPLSSIKGFATYFKGRFKDDPKDQDTATTMIQEVERLDRVIGQLLEFARPSSLNINEVRMADLVGHSLKLIEGDARSKNIEVKSEVPADLKEANLDADRMSQALLNLYLNSLQSMDEGGTLEVKVTQDEAIRRTTIMVSDNGKGIEPGDLERIFDPYFTTKPDGTGLGLAIVHKIVEAHTGEIKVESSPGLGTTITLILPYADEVDDRG